MSGLWPGLLHSRFNHSCIPNSKVPITGEGSIVSFATKTINVGEEIIVSYNPDLTFKTRRERHEALKYVCECKACQVYTPFQQVSDMRRRLLRGLQYLTIGKDLNGATQTSSPPIIVDAILKKSAESCSISLSARFIHTLLITCLLEAKGLLDDIMFNRRTSAILQKAELFQTESNSVIVRQVMEQETWLEKFGVASQLYGREAVADLAVAQQLREIQANSTPNRE